MEEARERIAHALAARGRDPDSSRAAARADRAARLLAGVGGRAVAIQDPGYPARLRDLRDPPPLLFLVGPWDHAGATVAIVGTRDPDDEGRSEARSLARDLAAAGIAVVSGLARGIDAAAHEGALEAGGRSGAVLGTSLVRVYPASHEALQRALARSLGLLSEILPGDPARRFSFASRNRLIAALADVIVVVQGGGRSGALRTADDAASLGRPVGAVPWETWNHRAAAPHQLLHDGRATLIRGARDVLALIARTRPELPLPPLASVPACSRRAPSRPAPGLAGTEAAVLAGLRRRPEPLDVVAARASLPASEVSAALLGLELAGLARREPGGRYRRLRSG